MRRPEKPIDKWSNTDLLDYYRIDVMRKARGYGARPSGSVNHDMAMGQISRLRKQYSQEEIKAMMDRHAEEWRLWNPSIPPFNDFVSANTEARLWNKIREGSVSDEEEMDKSTWLGTRIYNEWLEKRQSGN